MNPRWQVSFKGHLTGDALAELAQRGIDVSAGRVRLAADGTEHRRSTTVWLRASDARDAIAKVKATLALYGSFRDFEARPVNWLMYLGFLESEASAIEAVVGDFATEDPRVMGVVLSEPAKGSAEIMLEIPAATREDAVGQARAVYADLRSRAGLPVAEPLYGFLGRTGHYPIDPIQPPPRYVALRQRAQNLLDEGSYDYAVIAAQTACEVLTFEAITDLLKLSSEGGSTLSFATAWFEKNNRTPSLRDDRLRDLWNALAADQIQEARWWSSYQTHVVRRHGIVHRGSEATKSEAEHSLQASADFIEHVASKLQGILEQ
jgi:hypothetical protein